MSVCGVCSALVNRTGVDKVKCSNCKSYYHCNCVNLSKSDLDRLLENNIDWKCSKCTPLTIDIVVNLLNKLKSDILEGQKGVENGLKKSIDLCHGKINELSDSLNKQSILVKQQQDVIDKLICENETYKKTVIEMQKNIDQLEQYGRRNTVEIHGVPDIENEEVTRTVCKVFKALDLNTRPEDIDACHRLKKRPGKPTGIIVKLVRRFDAESVLQAARQKRLTTQALGYAERRPVYVNVSLSRVRSVLLGRARAVVREGKLAAAWVDRVGRVKIKKSDGMAPIEITSIFDLEKIVKALN